MILVPYGRILAETWKASDDVVVTDLDASRLEVSTGKRWIKTHRPELYEPLTVLTGLELDTRTVRFDRGSLKASRDGPLALWAVPLCVDGAGGYLTQTQKRLLLALEYVILSQQHPRGGR
jgi:hypothetical protein